MSPPSNSSVRSRGSVKKRSYKLEKKHVDFLCSHETLKKWTGYPLAQRCVLFHRVWTNKRITPPALSKLYRKQGVRLKAVRQFKLPSDCDLDRYVRLVDECREEVKDAIKNGIRLIYLDETVFTKRTYQTRDYGAKK